MMNGLLEKQSQIVAMALVEQMTGPALDSSSDAEGLVGKAVSDDSDSNGGALTSTEKHKSCMKKLIRGMGPMLIKCS